MALGERLPDVPVSNRNIAPYLVRAPNHAKAFGTAFRFRLAVLRKVNEIKGVLGDQGVLDLFTCCVRNFFSPMGSTMAPRWSSATLCVTSRPASSSAINTFFELHNIPPIAKDSVHLTAVESG
eukprot:jgi/Tetstr1/431734/TSEL_002224.t1